MKGERGGDHKASQICPDLVESNNKHFHDHHNIDRKRKHRKKYRDIGTPIRTLASRSKPVREDGANRATNFFVLSCDGV
jgi:hypothetical protein